MSLSLLLSLALGAAAIVPGSLRCENLPEPLGIDVTAPKLSWLVDAPARGERQTAYQLLVAGDPATLAADRGDLWDSGKVVSGENHGLDYAGAPLTSGRLCWWKVRVWDKAGVAGPWSAPARWSMGLLAPGDWQGQWIGYVPADTYQPATPVGATFDGAQWIWYPEGDPATEAPGGKRWFRGAFVWPANAAVPGASLLLTVDDRFVVWVNGQQVGASPGGGEPWRTPQTFDVAKWLRPGTNVVAIEATNDNTSPAGVLAKLEAGPVKLASGPGWRAANQPPAAAWRQPDFDDAGWAPVKVLGKPGIKPWGTLQSTGGAGRPWAQTHPSPVLRRGFTVAKPLRSAMAHVCGLGYYELHLNGRKVGDAELSPGFTRYDKRALYVTHDVTSYLQPGANAVGVLLGNGFYNSSARDAWNFQNAGWRDNPKLLLQLTLNYTDGTSETVVSDPTWRASGGPLVRDGVRIGEVYDARLEQDGWDRPGFDDARWANAAAVKAPLGKLVAQSAPPIRVTQTIVPVALKEVRPGVWVWDLGQSIAGRAQLKVSGPAGTRVLLRYAEKVRGDGSIDQGNINSLVHDGPFSSNEYILKGTGEEVYESRFDYHGYRWIEMTGFPGTPTLDNLRGRVLHTDFRPTGSFEASLPLLNTIQQATLWSYRGNFVGIPTDCPHREKNGWTGDAQLAAEQAMYNWDNAAGYGQWLHSFGDCQKDSGELPGIVPTYDWGYAWGNGAPWDSAVHLISWYLYVYRGDTRPLADNYETMKRYVDFAMKRAKNGIVSFGLGDWVPAKTSTPTDITNTAYTYVDATIVARAAKLLGKPDDAAKYTAVAETLRAAFDRQFNKGDGLYGTGSQTALSCALYQGLVPEALQPKVADRLAAAVDKANGHLDVGILGAKYLFHALSDHGFHDRAWKAATQTTQPSYAWWFKQGATTLWEDWGGGSSRNHIMFGDISGWFYQHLAGIRADEAEPGFKHVIIAPQPVAGLDWVKAHTDSVRGRIVSEWTQADGKLKLHVVIPPGSHATVKVPGTAKETETGAPGRADGGLTVFEVESGSWTFEP